MIKISARKYEGDDKYSWAVFRSDFPHFPVYSGLTKPEIPHFKKLVEQKIMEENLKKLEVKVGELQNRQTNF